jgi:hypothetical protein
VQSFKAPGRFVLGFLEEVKVVGSEEFLLYVTSMKKNIY